MFPALVYIGSIVPPRLPQAILEAMVELPGSTLTIIGYETAGHIGYSERLLDKARELGISDRVSLVGPIPSRSEMLDVVGRSDVGLVLLDQREGDFNLRTLAGASNKPFDYLARGLAVLVPNEPSWNSLMVEPGYGLECEPFDPASIAHALRWFADHPEETRQMGERGRQRIVSEWNYESQFAPVLRRLEGG